MKILLFIIGMVLLAGLFRWAVKFAKSERGYGYKVEPKIGRIVASVMLMFAYFTIAGGAGTMKEGERGVVLHMGAATGRVIEPGFYVVTPLLDSVEEMDITVHAEAARAESASIDLQVVLTEVTINYHIDSREVVKVYHDYRHEVVARAIKPAIQEAVKASTAKFKAEELITKRAEVKAEIERLLKARLGEVGLIVDAVNVTDFDFAPEYNRAIEQKVTALQEALKAENDLKRIEVEAQQRVAKARADADSMKLDADAKAYTLKVNAEAQAEALKLQKDAATTELIELRKVEAMLKALEKWDGKMPTFVGSGASPVPVLDVFSNTAMAGKK